MKIYPSASVFSLATILIMNAGIAWAGQTNPVKKNTDPKPALKTSQINKSQKYSFHEASSLSGITLKPDKASGNTWLHFDQRLNQPGTLLVKNNAGVVLYTNILQPAEEPVTHTHNIGRLKPGLYSIEVKTAETTFWKKVRVRN